MKLKRFIHRIKRHKRNKRLSNIADNIFYAVSNSTWNWTIFVHPLVYEIIRIKYLRNDCLVKLYSSLKVDYLAKDYTTIIVGA